MNHSSTAIEHIQNYCRKEATVAMAYWYFTFTDKNKQSTFNFLKSVIIQLYSRRVDTPLLLQTAYTECANGTLQPSPEMLSNLLKAVIDGFDDVFLILDALNEVPRTDDERANLLDEIHKICAFREDSIHILATSRKEIDIEEALQEIAQGQNYILIEV
jgi:hypothetical protein